MTLSRRLAAAALATAISLTALPAMAAKLVITLKDGDVVIALRDDLAPKHVERIVKLAKDGAYDNVAFHRVIEGFMAQTGDVQFGDMEEGFNPQRAGTGGSDMDDLPAEFSKEPFEVGVLGMARAMDPNSANSQFFIMTDPAPHLNGKYTVVGKVESGMEHVHAIKKGTSPNGAVANPDRMLKVRVEE